MKQYPSIQQAKGQKFEGLGLVDVFDKLDGQNMRFEFSRKQGWHKFGSRTQMVDAGHKQFGDAVTLFMMDYADILVTDCFKKTPQKLLVFAEYWGPNTFAGEHQEGDDLTLSIFDACVDNKGWLAPTEFRKAFEGKVPTPEWLGRYNWTRGFTHEVLENRIDGVTFEGVVGKTMKGNMLKMGKAKTKQWLEKVYAKCPQDVADRLSNS